PSSGESNELRYATTAPGLPASGHAAPHRAASRSAPGTNHTSNEHPGLKRPQLTTTPVAFSVLGNTRWALSVSLASLMAYLSDRAVRDNILPLPCMARPRLLKIPTPRAWAVRRSHRAADLAGVSGSVAAVLVRCRLCESRCSMRAMAQSARSRVSPK